MERKSEKETVVRASQEGECVNSGDGRFKA